MALNYNLFSEEEDPVKKLNLLFGKTPSNFGATSPSPPSGLSPDLRSADNYLDDTSSGDMPTPQAKKPSLLSRIFPREAQTSVDEYGIEKPKSPAGGILSKILGVALPALYGATQGIGVLPGALTGINALGMQRQKQYEGEMDNYQKLRQAAITRNAPTAEQKNFEFFKGLPEDQKGVFEEYKTLSRSPYESLRYELSKDNAKFQQDQAQQNRKQRMNENLDKKVTKLSDSLGNSQELVNALGEVDKALGFKIDDYDDATNKLTTTGKKVNLPGFNFPGYGRVSFYSDKAQNLDTAISRIFNIELKDRSGAAVTNPEMQRMREEFAAGKFNTEAQKLAAIKAYKGLLYQQMKNIEAGYNPSVVQEYKGRSGLTSDAIKPREPVGAKYKKRGSDGKLHYVDETGKIDLGVAE